MASHGMSRHRSIGVLVVLSLLVTACSMSDDDSTSATITGSDNGTSSETDMPSGLFTSEWPDDPSDFANN